MSHEQSTKFENLPRIPVPRPFGVDSIVLLLVILIVVTFFGHCQVSPTRWEYISTCSPGDDLKRLGEDGWELVTIEHVPTRYEVVGNDSPSNYFAMYIYKRPKGFLFSNTTRLSDAGCRPSSTK
jgi:hypothetical protein